MDICCNVTFWLSIQPSLKEEPVSCESNEYHHDYNQVTIMKGHKYGAPSKNQAHNTGRWSTRLVLSVDSRLSYNDMCVCHVEGKELQYIFVYLEGLLWTMCL